MYMDIQNKVYLKTPASRYSHGLSISRTDVNGLLVASYKEWPPLSLHFLPVGWDVDMMAKAGGRGCVLRMTEQQERRSPGPCLGGATISVLNSSLKLFSFWFFVTTIKTVSCLIHLFTQILANISSISRYCDRHSNQIIH